MTEAAAESAIDLRLGRWQDVLADVECDALLVDAPYSARTHGAYRAMAEVRRRSISYDAFSADDVDVFVRHWSPRTRGWFVALTDHVLAPAWEKALNDAGRYVFAPIACVEPNGRVRLSGDGPSQWSVWAVVARPRDRSFATWGALPGAYITPATHTIRMDQIQGARTVNRGVMGAKSQWLMQSLIRDYTRPNDLVCDPCAGGGTTLLAAAIEGRRAVGAECLEAHYEIARRRIGRGYTPSLFADL